MTRYSIHHIPGEERPRERLIRSGAESLSAIELIAIILGSGSQAKPILQLAHEIMGKFGNLQGLAEATVAELLEINGIGLAKAVQLKAAVNLGMRATKQEPRIRYRIEHPVHAYHLIKDALESEKRELFVVIMQDAKGYLIAWETVSIGSLSQAIVHPREVFYPAIRNKASGLIVAHNHPSGDPSPSTQDLELTKVLVEAGRLVGIPLHDHLIVGRGQFISLRQTGVSF
jgi:DNA repair protein RadC